MKLFMAVTAAAAATVLVGVSMAAESDKFVIRGDAAKQLLEQNSIKYRDRRGHRQGLCR